MGWRAVLVLMAVLALGMSSQPGAEAAGGNWLPPMVAPLLKGLCDVVHCGRGSCRVNGSYAFGYACECDPGWTKLLTKDDNFQFLPCIIPNCSLDYSCDNRSAAPPPSLPPSSPSNRSIFEPCEWSYCGEGSCVKTSDYDHRCDCKKGYANLLNTTTYPCIRECVLGADCDGLGIMLPNGSSPRRPPSNQSDQAINRAATGSQESLMWILLLMLSLAMAPRI